MIVATRMETLTKDEETGEEKLYLNDLILCKDCKHYWESAKMCTNTGMPLNDYCEPIDFCSKAEKEEEPKEDAEKFIDSLHETVLLAIKRHNLIDLFELSENSIQYAKGRETAFKEILEMIEKYKEKK